MDAAAEMPLPKFKFVFIPADSTQPMEELEQEIVPGKEVECLTNRLQAHFRDTAKGTEGAAASREARRRMLSQHMKGVEVTDTMMDAVSGMQLVESVAMLSGGPDNGFTHINLYVDDTGAMKGLPDNTRAAGLAAAAGHPCDVHGDAFVGRVVDCDDKFERQDFTLAEVDSSAAWIAVAQSRNARRRENAARLPDMMPSATRVDSGALAFEAEQADKAVDATQRTVEGKLYTYAQDNEEVVLEVKVPAETKSKDVRCAFKPDRVSLVVATLPEAQREVLSGELFQRVKADECSWSLATQGGERVLQLTLTKQQPLRWLGILRSG